MGNVEAKETKNYSLTELVKRLRDEHESELSFYKKIGGDDFWSVGSRNKLREKIDMLEQAANVIENSIAEPPSEIK
jgi:hypothetical protein